MPEKIADLVARYFGLRQRHQCEPLLPIYTKTACYRLRPGGNYRGSHRCAAPALREAVSLRGRNTRQAAVHGQMNV